ncbi:uncharacterized protein [Panulirus ornatus]|uniref:uncharacterized protein n=1 Tax=Panulirus ornatus TaxID=150431 RepID=UPI003A890870
MDMYVAFMDLERASVESLGNERAWERSGCQPDCAGKTPGDAVADPTDCRRFYICLDDGAPTDRPFSCPDDEKFDVVTSKCSSDGECATACPLLACHLSCNEVPDLIADPKDCNRFYVCTGESTEGPFQCPLEDPFFDGIVSVCGNDSSKCCTDLCFSYCLNAGVDIPDPLDCTSFYRCSAVGPVGEDMHLACPRGENFDIPRGECASDAPCTVLCEDIMVPTSTLVTPTPSCLDSLTCAALGYFPKCNICQPEYFYCMAIGQPALLQRCTEELVFNPHPDYPYCVLPPKCPYLPAI